MDFRITTFGVNQAASTIEEVGNRAMSARPAFEEIYLTILDINAETFDKEGARGDFPKWVKNSIDTVLWKANRKLSPMILRATEKLFTAVTTYRSPDVSLQIRKDSIVFTPKLAALPYARIQQKGGRAGGVNIPARPYIRFTEQDAAAFSKEISRHIMGRSSKIRPSFGQ